MATGEGGMKDRLPAKKTTEALGKVSGIRLGFPIGPETPGGHGLVVFPIVPHYVPFQLVPCVRSACCSERPVTQRNAGGIHGAILLHHVRNSRPRREWTDSAPSRQPHQREACSRPSPAPRRCRTGCR